MTEGAPSKPVRRSPLWRLAAALLVLVAVGAAVTARVVWEGEKAVAASTEALRAGDADAAIVHARDAAGWYAPGAPHVRVGYERLMSIAREAERRKLWQVSLFAYRAVVTASASTRWLLTPHATEAQEATNAIARIEGKVGERAPDASTEPAAALERAQLEALAEDVRPDRFFTAVLVASFIGMLVGLAGFLRFGLDDTGRVRLGRATPGVIAAGVGLVGYCLALYLA